MQPLKKMHVPYPQFDTTQSCYNTDVSEYYLDKNVNPNLIREINKREEELRKLCSTCKFLNSCREYAIHHERYGFWGGMSAAERTAERSKRKIACITPDLKMKDYKGDWK